MEVVENAPPLREKLRRSSPNFDAVLHDKLLSFVRSRRELSEAKMRERYAGWNYAQSRLQPYRPAEDADDKEARAARHPIKFVVPVSAILNQAYLYYLMNVFSRDPIFELTGRDEKSVEASRRVERRLHSDFYCSNGLVALYNLFFSARFFGMGWIKNVWEVKKRRAIVTEEVLEPLIGLLPMLGSKSKIRQVERDLIDYEGNCAYAIDVRNVFPDTRLPLAEFQRGEFIVETMRRSWTSLKWRERDGIYVNVEELANGGVYTGQDQARYHGESVPSIENRADDRDKGYAVVEECWARLIPSEYGLSSSDAPELWVISCGNSNTVLRAEKAELGRDEYPFSLVQDQPLSFEAFNPSSSETIAGIEQTIEWLINSACRSAAKSVNSFIFYRPDLLKNPAEDLRNTEFGAAVRVREDVPIDSAVLRVHVPFDLGQFLPMAMHLFNVVERLMGVSENVQGVPSKVEKTATEIRAVNQSSVGRLQMTAILYAVQGTIPLARQQVANLQKYVSNDEQRLSYQGEFDYPILEGTIFDRADTLMDYKLIAEMAAQLGVPLNGIELLKNAAEIKGVKNWKDIIAPAPSPAPAQGLEAALSAAAAAQGMPGAAAADAMPRIAVLPDQELDKQIRAGNLVGAY